MRKPNDLQEMQPKQGKSRAAGKKQLIKNLFERSEFFLIAVF
ncbi:MAG: hypothetical protein OT643_07815 [Bacteroidetes bacterium]|nr:hypothetical protein [Bacteroidota bacterium]